MAETEDEHDRLGIKVSNRLLRRLQRHISVSNYSLKQDLSQQEWIHKAVAEKLEREKNNPEMHHNSLKQITIRLNQSLKSQLDKTIDQLKSMNNRTKSYSKKSWILEAIEEKLEEEEDN